MSTKRIMTPSSSAAREAGDGAVQRPDDDRDQRREEADLERRLAAGHDPPELVEAVLVGAQGPRGAPERRWPRPAPGWRSAAG